MLRYQNWSRTLLVLGGLLQPFCAHAQDTQISTETSTPASREEALQRMNGMKLGSFTLQPSLAVRTGYNDNIYATSSDRTDDIVTQIMPRIALRSQLDRHKLNGTAFYSRRIYAKHSGQDASEYGGQVEGQLAATRELTFGLTAVAQSLIEDRTSTDSNRQTINPINYTNLEGRLFAGYDSQTIFADLTARVRRVSYGDADIDGVSVDQSSRDLTLAKATLRTGYKVGKLTDIFGNVELERRRYDVRPGDPRYDPLVDTDRNSHSLRIEAGVRREVTPLVSGTVRLGYLKFNYVDPRLKDVGEFSYYADLRWSASPLTTAALSASRTIDETVSPRSAGNLRDEVRLTVDHELLRTVFLQAALRYARVTPVGDDARSRELQADLSARYYVGRRFRLSLTYSRKSRTSRDESIAYKGNTLFIGLEALP